MVFHLNPKEREIQDWDKKFNKKSLPLIFVGLILLFFLDDLLYVFLVKELQIFTFSKTYYTIFVTFFFFGSVFLALAVLHILRKRPQTGSEGLIGQQGIVVGKDDGIYKIKVHGELWSAECEQHVQINDKVEIIAINNLLLQIRKISR
jgi:membrane-bound serine protease (ClpP class)